MQHSTLLPNNTASNKYTVITYATFYFAVAISLYVTLPVGHPLRWMVYAATILTFLELSLSRLNVNGTWLGILYVYLAYTIGTSILNMSVDGAIKDIAFISLFLSLAALKFRTTARFPQVLVILAGGGALALALTSDDPLFALSLAPSQSAAETSLGMALPLVTLFFLLRRQYLWAIISLFVCLLIFKRVAIASLLIVLVYEYFRSILSPTTSRVLDFVAIGLICFAGLNIDLLAELASNHSELIFGQFMSPNQITTGRYRTLSAFNEYFVDAGDWLKNAFGHGAGYTSFKLQAMGEALGFNVTLVHNDWFRIKIEYGLVGLSLFLALIFRMFGSSQFVRMGTMYSIICFLTGNILTFYFYWVIFIFLSRTESQGVPYEYLNTTQHLPTARR